MSSLKPCWRIRSELHLLRILAALTDLLPSKIRYGHVRALWKSIFGAADLPGLMVRFGGDWTERRECSPSKEPLVKCLLIAGSLGLGGVEVVVETLATRLASEGVLATVLCTGGGETADRIRAAGVDVTEISGAREFAEALGEIDPDVIQVHSLPRSLYDVLRGWGGPCLWVLHNIEIHRTREDWRALAEVTADAACIIAVSESVRRYHFSHIPKGAADVAVVPNGADTHAWMPRDSARAALAAMIPLAPEDIVVLCLARYDAQKNLPALIQAFGAAAAREPRLRLVVAGANADMLEYRWTEAERKAGDAPERIHLLGPSDGMTLLAAADAFILTSFFEGWSVAATEAVVTGLPVILSDVGGAAELAELAPTLVSLVPSAVDATSLNYSSIRAARRRRPQPNFDELVDALVRLSQSDLPQPPRAETMNALSLRQMIGRHAGLLRRAAVHGSFPTRERESP